VFYDQQAWTKAMVEFKKGAQLDPSDVYNHIRIFLTDARTGHREDADRELIEAIHNLRPGDDTRWPSRIIAFLRHEVSEREFLSKTASDTKQGTLG
jgi:lipoprotein NlpI